MLKQLNYALCFIGSISGTDNNNYAPSGQTFNEQVDLLARNFFSKFCFYIKSVSRDPAALKADLKRQTQAFLSTSIFTKIWFTKNLIVQIHRLGYKKMQPKFVAAMRTTMPTMPFNMPLYNICLFHGHYPASLRLRQYFFVFQLVD